MLRGLRGANGRVRGRALVAGAVYTRWMRSSGAAERRNGLELKRAGEAQARGEVVVTPETNLF